MTCQDQHHVAGIAECRCDGPKMLRPKNGSRTIRCMNARLADFVRPRRTNRPSRHGNPIRREIRDESGSYLRHWRVSRPPTLLNLSRLRGRVDASATSVRWGAFAPRLFNHPVSHRAIARCLPTLRVQRVARSGMPCAHHSRISLRSSGLLASLIRATLAVI
jgi:hypothetical protein